MDITQKRFLTIEEFCQYTGLKKSYVYKLNHYGMIPGVTKPLGNKLFFDRPLIEEWMAKGIKPTKDELDRMAATYINTGKI